MGWNWLDWALLGIVGVSTVAGVWQGLIRETISLASLVGGLILAALEYPRAAEWLRVYVESPEAAKCLGFLGLFIGTIVVGAVISFLLRRIVQKAGLAWFDRFLGGIFGLVRGCVVTFVLLLAMVAFSIQTATVQESTLAPYFVLGSRAVGALMPQDLNSRFHRGLDQFKQALIEKDKKERGK